MVCHVLGLGKSIHDFKEYEGYRIGVNDIDRYTYADRVIVVNDFKKLTDRKHYIDSCRPLDGLWSQLNQFRGHPNYMKLTMQSYNGVFKPNKIYFSKSSPFIALSMAISMGFKEIVIWGVDFVDHPLIKDKLKLIELNNFNHICQQANKLCIKVYKGSDISELNLPVWQYTKAV